MDKDQLIEKIKLILEEIEPYIIGHGGHISFVDYEIETGRVLVSLHGSCENCSLSTITIKFGLEEAIKKQLPQVREVVQV